MTWLPGFHMHLVVIGDQLHLQMSYISPASPMVIECSATGSVTLQAEICSACLVTSRRIMATLPAFPLPTDLIIAEQLRSSFRLCDPEAVDLLTATGVLKRNSP